MLVELGNTNPVLTTAQGAQLSRPDNGALITYAHIPDPHIDRNNQQNAYGFDPDLDAASFRQHVLDALLDSDGITRHPDNEAAVALLHPRDGLFAAHSKSKPSFVWSDNEAFSKFVGSYYNVPWFTGDERPANYVGDYWRKTGKRLLAPGVTFEAGNPPQNLVTNVGRLVWDDTLGGGQVGATGAGTAATGGSLTTASTYTLNQWAGYRVYVYSTTGTLIVWGNVISNTSGASSVLTVDQWYVAATPGGSAATTPTTPWAFIIADGGSTSAWFQGISSTNITPAATDVSLSGETTTNGLARKIAAFAITSATTPTTFTWTATYTYSTTGSLTIYAASQFVSNVKTDTTDTMVTEDLLSASATVAASGDQITVTATETGP
jgi:hypothetical protein